MYNVWWLVGNWSRDQFQTNHLHFRDTRRIKIFLNKTKFTLLNDFKQIYLQFTILLTLMGFPWWDLTVAAASIILIAILAAACACVSEDRCRPAATQ